ncbi:MAG: hypothetical protein ACK4Y8_08705 [Bacteroidota bacterium]|jgi:heme-degrading monooxygenase HmoA
MDAIRNWAADPLHIEAKQKGKSTWYRYHHIILAEVKSLHAREIQELPK